MQVIGIIAEYNPFHNGHLHQLSEVRARFPDARFVCAMSGQFTQRGEAAILDKWQRAKMAVMGGMDLVLELPFAFAVRSAQHFAFGGVALLHRLGIVSHLAFGTECADLAQLQRIALATDSPRLKPRLRNGLDAGLSYAAALGQALAELSGTEEHVLKGANTILAVEYLRSLRKLASPILPLPILREGAAHHEMELHGEIASAAAIRHVLRQPGSPDARKLKQVLPKTSLLPILRASEQNNFPQETRLFPALLAALRRAARQELRGIYGIHEGMENKLLDAAGKSQSWEEILHHCKSKRYPRTSLQRLLPHILLRFSRAEAKGFDEVGPLYARVLAFNSRGREILRACKAHAALPIVTKLGHFLTSRQRDAGQGLSPLQAMLSYDTWATDLYGLCFATIKERNQDFLASPSFLP